VFALTQTLISALASKTVRQIVTLRRLKVLSTVGGNFSFLIGIQGVETPRRLS